jgi:hypothetical protein
MFDQEDQYMTVRRTENSGIPASTPEPITDIKDGTSNTVQAHSSQSILGSKDVFETSGLKAGASEVLYEKFSARGEANGLKAQDAVDMVIKSPRESASGLKADSNEVAVETFTARGESKGLKAQDAVDFMDYTDDSAD